MIKTRVEDVLKDRAAYRSVFPLTGSKDLRKKDYCIVGFDTEFNNTEVLSYQLYYNESNNVVLTPPCSLSIEEVVEEAYKLCEGKNILLPSYFNMAELRSFSNKFWETPYEYHQVHPKNIFHVEGDYNGIHFLFYDLWHFFVGGDSSSGLSAVAKDFGYEKLEYDVTDLTRENLSDPDFIKYAINDAKLCTLIYNDLEKILISKFGVSLSVRQTSASLAVSAYKLNYLHNKLGIPDSRVRKLSLKCNWAARVECGYVGNVARVWEHDADSFYPRSVVFMKTLPTCEDWRNGLPSDMKGEGICHVEFMFPRDTVWPCLPVWTGDSLLFPLSGETYCTIGELRLAIKHGCIIKRLYDAYHYIEGSENSFINFIIDSIAMKERAVIENNPSMKAIAKLLLNSSIGKLIQNKGGMNWDMFSEWARNQNDVQYVLDVMCGKIIGEGIPDFREKTRIGGTFLPEWHTLILGKSRELIGESIYKSITYPKIINVSTDAIMTTNNILGYDLPLPFNIKYCGVSAKFIRGKQYVYYNGEEIIKSAHHAIHLPQGQAGKLLLNNKNEVEYSTRRFNTMKDMAYGRGDYGNMREINNMKVKIRPEMKRQLTDDGYTMPWLDINSYFNHKNSNNN